MHDARVGATAAEHSRRLVPVQWSVTTTQARADPACCSFECLRAARGCRPNREIPPVRPHTIPTERTDSEPSWSLVSLRSRFSLPAMPDIRPGGETGTCGIHPVPECLRAAKGCRAPGDAGRIGSLPPIRITPPEKTDPGPSWSLVSLRSRLSPPPAPHIPFRLGGDSLGIRPVLGSWRHGNGAFTLPGPGSVI
jgi:hypothetical protein